MRVWGKRTAARAAIVLVVVLGAASCGRQQARVTTSHRASSPGPADAAAATASRAPGSAPSPLFVDVTKQSGVSFHHNSGAFGRKWLPETLGPGVVIFDADGDGRPDILFVNGTRFKGHPGKKGTMVFYHNLGGMRFADETKRVGLDISAYCLGGAAGDLDNDGDEDLYLSCLGHDHLLWNEGGHFVDGTAAAGIKDSYHLGVSVALLDADRDGRLDILAARYVTWTPERDLFCTLDGVTKTYCTPESYPGASPRFYHNLGGGRFADETKKAGFYEPNAKSLGIAVLDVDGDGWPDVAISNDTEPNLLFHNRGNGTFQEIGVPSGMAFSEAGVARGGMGIDAADFDHSGRPSLVIGNFANEMVGLYRNEGHELFVDSAPSSQLGRKTLLSLTFGTFFFDYDLDGWLDLLVANGHLDPTVEKVQPNVRYAQPTQLFHNAGGGHFVDVTASVGGDLGKSRVARGAAWADLDGDGDPDVVLTTNGGPAYLFENRLDHTAGHHWLELHLVGTKSNRDGIGAEVSLVAGGATQHWLVRTGESYISQSQIDPLFGLGRDKQASKVTIVWPSGERQTLENVAGDRRLTVHEPR